VLPKVLGITLVLISLTVAAALTGIVLQTIKGYTNYEIGKYLYWYILPEAVSAASFAALAVFFQVISPHKFVGWGLMVLYTISRVVMGNLGYDHPLYNYGASIGVPLSDMNGQGDYRGFAWVLDAYWGAFALLLLVLSYACGARDRDPLPASSAAAAAAADGRAGRDRRAGAGRLRGPGRLHLRQHQRLERVPSSPGWERQQAAYEKACCATRTPRSRRSPTCGWWWTCTPRPRDWSPAAATCWRTAPARPCARSTCGPRSAI
jgi:hypothetical protein